MIKVQILCTCTYFVPAADRSLLLSDSVSCIPINTILPISSVTYRWVSSPKHHIEAPPSFRLAPVLFGGVACR